MASRPELARPLLEVAGLTKSFLRQRVLNGVNLTLHSGEIHALLGENGAGKSTLIKAVTGVVQRDAGTVMLDGVEIMPRDAEEAVKLGIATVYQEVNLLPNLTVAENLFLGRQPTRFGLVRDRDPVVDAAHRDHADRAAGAVHQLDVLGQQVVDAVLVDRVRVAPAHLHQLVVTVGLSLCRDLGGQRLTELCVAIFVDVLHRTPPPRPIAVPAWARRRSAGRTGETSAISIVSRRPSGVSQRARSWAASTVRTVTSTASSEQVMQWPPGSQLTR